MESVQDFVASHSPASIINIFNNALSSEATRKIIRVKGIYTEGRGVIYGGYYYDSLEDENTDATITLIVPAVMRHSLVSQQTIEISGYITKRVNLVGARIELQLNIIEIIGQVAAKYTDEQLQGFEILQKKAELGYRDVDSFIKTKILKGEQIAITVLIGRNAIIDSDIKHQLQEAIGLYQFEFIRINLSSEQEIVAAINTYQEVDILIISRGGGDNLDLFDKPSIAKATLGIAPYFVTAIGHKENNSLLQKVADKAFITPTALGQYFNDLYNETIEQLQNSKAKLVEDITTQLKGEYEKQVANLREKLNSVEELHRKALDNSTGTFEKEIAILRQQMQMITDNHKEQMRQIENLSEEKLKLVNAQLLDAKNSASQKGSVLPWIFVAIALLVGLLLGKGCN